MEPPTPTRGSGSDSAEQLSFLSALLQRKYDLWALNNSEAVSHIETSLKTLLFFLPGRFKEQELGSELFQSALGLFGAFNDSIWLKYTFSEGFMRPPPSTLHKDLAARLGIATADQSSQTAANTSNQSPSGAWVDQFNSFSQLMDGSDDPSKNLSEKLAGKASAIFNPTQATPVDPNSLFGSGQITADVQRKLSKLFRRLPHSLSKNFSLHAILSFFDHAELVLEISASYARNWLSNTLSPSSSSVIPAVAPTTIQSRMISSLKLIVIFTIEMIKAVIRLILLVRNGGKVLVNQSIPPRDALVRSVGTEDDQRLLLDAMTLRLAGKHRRKTLSDVEKEKRKFISTPATAKLAFGELLWIIRPLVYLLSLVKHGKKSWKPWFLSLLLDLASRSCSWDAELNEAETQEMYRRGFLWFFYLIRSPFFEFAVGDPTEPGSRISRLFELLQRVPLVGALSASLAEFFLVYRKRYFYTAGSSS
eukprot:TRINITY_DN2491_c0_g1_i5.p1 TRINITY_DN2491_c0_g1~~TRINITY_DN2491_c0_g1_i5.p1  ORF type:complete len:486 (-),score=89.59 TRINITY_DN2491_c0_g1_i5:558-1988(-)